MKTITLTRKQTTWNGFHKVHRELATNWKGPEGIKLCNAEFRRYFSVPRGCLKVHLVFTKRPHPEAYLMEAGQVIPGYDHVPVPMLDGWEPSLMMSAKLMHRKLWNEGYNYVRCEVEV